jgi:metal-responsive CopG/Arc/MetJ family transcriptional regulator
MLEAPERLLNTLQCTTMHVMEDQITVRLPAELTKALKEMSARMQRKRSEVVRMAVAEFLQVAEPAPERRAARVKNLLGSVNSGIPDLATRHRDYLINKLRRGR